jgi:thiamine pyrophosphate-dependent acetolactate synthase large subunit-like protein
MDGYDVCIRACVAADVRTIFTLMSEDVMGLVSRCRSDWDEEMSVIDARHEGNAVAMADAYARATDGVGVCVVGRGPSVAQTGTALTTARKAGSSLLVLTAESALDRQTEDKNFDQQGYLESTVGEVVSIRAVDSLPERMTDVLRRLRGGDGPIAVQIPNDVLNGAIQGVPGDWLPTERVTPPTQEGASLSPEPERIDEIVDSYLDSDATKPPVIIAGDGARRANARTALERVAERMNAVLTTTLRGRDLFHDHPYHAGLVGTLGTNVANELLADSDFVLAVGCSLNEKTTDSGRLIADEATVVHVDTKSLALGRHASVDVPVVGDARTVAEQFDEKLAEHEIDFDGKFWTERMQRRIADGTEVAQYLQPQDSGGVHPGALVAELDELLPDDRMLVTDGGHFTMWVLDGIEADGPDNFVWLYEFLSIGLGFPAGIGTAQAVVERPEERRCVAFCGDAGFMMSLQEIDTAVRHELPLTVVVMNDEALGSEYHKLQKRGQYAESATVETPAIADVAEAMGAAAHTVRSVSDLEAIRESLVDPPSKPLILDCRTDREVRHRYYE